MRFPALLQSFHNTREDSISAALLDFEFIVAFCKKNSKGVGANVRKRKPPKDLIVVSVEIVLVCWNDGRISGKFKTEAEVENVNPGSNTKKPKIDLSNFVVAFVVDGEHRQEHNDVELQVVRDIREEKGSRFTLEHFLVKEVGGEVKIEKENR